MSWPRRALICSLALIVLSPALIGAGTAPAPASSATSATPAASSAVLSCLPTGNGYLRARIRGALNLDIDWGNAEIECEGGPRR